MKKSLAVIIVLSILVLFGVQSVWAGRVAKRQFRQNQRVAQGVHSGELTRGETRRLAKQQHRIQHAKRQAWSDGTLTRREKVGLEIRQDKASADIYRLKHNDRDRH